MGLVLCRKNIRAEAPGFRKRTGKWILWLTWNSEITLEKFRIEAKGYFSPVNTI